MFVRHVLRAVWILLICSCSQPEAPVSSTKLANHGLLTAALTPDGLKLFTGSFQHGGALWDQVNRARIYDWNHGSGGYSAYHAADFSEDGKFLAATDGTVVTVWNTELGEPVLYLESPAQSVAIQNTSMLWQTKDAEAENYWQRPARILDLALSKQYILLGLENQVALLVDSTQQLVVGALNHSDVITDIAMDDDAQFAVTGSRDGIATLWSLEDGSIVKQFKRSSPISFVAISPAGNQIIVAAARGPITLETIADSASIVVFSGNPGISSASFSSDGDLMLGSSREHVWLVDPSTGQTLQRWQIPKDGPWHKAAIVAVHKHEQTAQAIASNGFAYALKINN